MSTTVADRLDELTAQRGLRWAGGSDVSSRTGPRDGRNRLVGPFWACAYDPRAGVVVAFVSGVEAWTTAKRRLLEALEGDAPAPEILRRRTGRIAERFGRERVRVAFDDDGRVEELAHPSGVTPALEAGDPVVVLQPAGDPLPVLLWGREHVPRRETQRPLDETLDLSPEHLEELWAPYRAAVRRTAVSLPDLLEGVRRDRPGLRGLEERLVTLEVVRHALTTGEAVVALDDAGSEAWGGDLEDVMERVAAAWPTAGEDPIPKDLRLRAPSDDGPAGIRTQI